MIRLAFLSVTCSLCEDPLSTFGGPHLGQPVERVGSEQAEVCGVRLLCLLYGDAPRDAWFSARVPVSLRDILLLHLLLFLHRHVPTLPWTIHLSLHSPCIIRTMVGCLPANEIYGSHEML